MLQREQVFAKDILAHDLDGNPLEAGDRKPYLERFIHAAIYRARPDVQAVVHSHSPSIIPFGVTATPLRPVYHMSAFLGAGTPIFEIRQAAGMTDMLIRDDTLAAALAKSLAENPVVLMRGHGDTVVANSIPQVVYRAIYTEMNARLQAQAAALGTINFLSAEEAAKAAATNDGQVLRPWELWKARIGKIDQLLESGNRVPPARHRFIRWRPVRGVRGCRETLGPGAPAPPLEDSVWPGPAPIFQGFFH